MKHHAAYSLHEVTPLSDQELIQNILLSAKNALVHSDDFKEKFVSKTNWTSWAGHLVSQLSGLHFELLNKIRV